uniref:UBC core domain-containing protein n=1 Tax=viral metagenome TaxID=1070528 RepID=A0A6C0D299_9ZZZZ
MNRAQNRMYRMIERFEELRGNMSIGDYFQVPMKITIKHPDIMNITCKFELSVEVYVKLELPFELNCIILSYLHEPSYAEFIIIVPNDYPFKPPVWLLMNADKKRYKQMYNAGTFHNSRYRHSWEPSISFEKDILYMIESIYLNQ